MNIRKQLIVSGLAAVISLGLVAPTALAVPQSDLDSAAEQLSTYGAELSSLQDDLAKKTSDLEKTSYKIGEKQAAIEQTKEELVTAKAVLSARMRSSYKSGAVSLLGVLLGADSIDDIISRVYYMDKIASNDANAIQQVRDLEERLSDEVNDLEKTRSKQQKAVDQLQTQVDEYEVKVAEARDYYDALDAQVQAELAAQQQAEEEANMKAAMEAIEEQQAIEERTETPQNDETPDDNDESETQQKPQQQEEPEEQDEEQTPTTPTSYAPAGSGLSTAYAAIGSPYVYGAAGPSSFDCSGLVCYAYGYARGRTTYDMISSLKSTGSWKNSMSELSAGDLVFTDQGHVGIYIGGGMMIHAPRPGKTVCEQVVWSCIGGGTY